MFCMTCGATLRDGARFCHSCGAPVDAQNAPAAAPQPAVQQPPAVQQQYAMQAQSQSPAVQQPMGQPAVQQPPALQQQYAMQAQPQSPAVQQPPAAQQPMAQSAAQPQQPSASDHPITEPPVLNRRTLIQTPNGKRSQILFPCSSSPDAAVAAAQSVLQSSGFKQREYHNELVWKKGTGMATAMQYVVVAPYGDGLLVQGWVQVGVGSAGLSEMALDGFVGAIPKKSVLKVIERIRQSI